MILPRYNFTHRFMSPRRPIIDSCIPALPNRWRRFRDLSDGASVVEYAVVLAMIAVFLVGASFLGSGLNHAFTNVNDSIENKMAFASGRQEKIPEKASKSASSETTPNETASSREVWKYTWNYALIGLGLIAGSAYATFRRVSKRPENAASDKDIALPISIQVELFEKRQQLFHTLMKDQTGLWENGLQVRHLMSTKLVTVTPTASLEEITSLMKEKGVHQVLVCKDDRTLQGVLYSREVASKTHGVARNWMMPPRNTTTPDTPINQAITCLIQERLSCMPVLEDGKLVGLISTSDMLLALQCTLQIWGYFAELLKDDFLGGLDTFEQEMDEQRRQIDKSLNALAAIESKTDVEEIVPLIVEIRKIYERLHGFTGKINHYRSHCLENVKMVQKLVDF
jgi:CBS domain-containing protein/Flp pilus assembly pilin Flp